jgi:hypothetical protein
MSRAPETARVAARAVRDAFGGEPRVLQYLDEPEEHEVGILIGEERPGPGFTSFSTVTLHLYENRMDDRDIRVELTAVVESWAEAMANALATAALNVIKDGWLAAPGVVFPDLLSEYDLSQTFRNVVWMPEPEREVLFREGYDAFDQLLEQQDVECWNLNREPLV